MFTPISQIESVYLQQRLLSNRRVIADVSQRIAMLRSLRESIQFYENELLQALLLDLGKSNYESFLTEIGGTLQEIKFHLRNIKKWASKRRVATPLFLFPSKSYQLPEPYGQVLIMAPWNYPFQLLMNPLVGAISAGNRVILRPSPEVPNVALVIEKIILKAFIPENVFVVLGGIEENQWLLARQWDYIFFTGGPFLGRIVAKAAAEKLIPVTLELGGKSPAIVGPGANLRLAAKRILWGKLVNAGQTCIAPDYVWVHRDLLSDFVAASKRSILEMYGDEISRSVDYGKLVNEKALQRVGDLIPNASGDVLVGGRVDASNRLIEPTLIAVNGWDAPSMKEEIFGPVLPILTYDHLDEVISDINEHAKPLALYYFGDDSGAERVLRNTSAGGVSINDTLVHVANHHLPFGGVGGSGHGQYRGKHTFETFSHLKSVMKSSTWFDIPIKYPPYGKLGFLRWMMK